MQPTSTMTDYIEFKDEIMKRIRLLENKLSSDFKSKFSQISLGFEKLDMKINSITQNNNSLLGLITNQNFNIEKFAELEEFKIKAEQNLLRHDIKIKNIIQELEKLKIRYDKILNDNLIVPGYVGPGSQHKNLADYVIYQINEFQKIRNDTEQTRNKVDNSSRIALNAVNTSFAQFQRYTDEKNKDTRVMLERRYNQFSDKILELEMELNKYQFKIEKQMKPIQGDIQKLIKIRNDPEFNNEKKFEDLNKKLNIMLEEFDIMKSTNKEWDSKIINYGQTNNSSELLNSKNNSKYKVVNKSNNELKNYNFSKMNSPSRKTNKNSSKNIMLYDNEEKNSSIINSGLPKVNKELGSPQKSTFSKNQKEDEKYNNNENNNSNNIFEEQNFINKKNHNQKVNNKNEENKDQMFNNSDELFLSKGDSNENEMEKINIVGVNKDEDNNNNDMDNAIESINKKKLLDIEKYIKLPVNKNNEKEKKDKIKYIDKDTDGEYLSQINSQMKINKKNIKEKLSNKKITIDGLYKQKKFAMSDSLMDINTYKAKKDDENYINKKSSTKIITFDKFEDKKVGTISKGNNTDNGSIIYPNSNTNKNKNINIYDKNNTNNYNNNSNLSTNINFNIHKKDNNINNISNLNILPKTSKHSFLNKKEGNSTSELLPKNKKKFYNLQMNVNEEQKQIMKKIRDYYNNKKIFMEKKLQDNIVDCNIINLNKRDPSEFINIKFKNSSAKNTFYASSKSTINENRNNLREIAMQINPYLGRTNYRFFSQKSRINNLKNYSSFDNKSNDNF